MWAAAVLFGVSIVPHAGSGATAPHAATPFTPTMEDVAPGVDHGNTDDNLPEQFQRHAVFYRSQHPVGTIIIETGERHLYLIESETRALRYGIGVGRDGFTWPACCRSPARPNGRTGIRRRR